MPFIRNFHLLTALITTCLVSGLATPAPTWAAAGFNCEVTIPFSVAWSDYFDEVGNSIFFDDDECGMSVPLGPDGGHSDDGSVAIAMDPAPHQSYARFFVQGSDVELGGGSYVTIFRMADTRSGASQPIAEIRLATNAFGGHILQLVVTDDSGISKTYALGMASANGNIIHVEVSKSTTANPANGYVTNDGFVAVDVNNGVGTDLVVGSLEIWNRLPTEARFGAVQATGSAGDLVFQPMEFGQRFFSASPQN